MDTCTVLKDDTVGIEPFNAVGRDELDLVFLYETVETELTGGADVVGAGFPEWRFGGA